MTSLAETTADPEYARDLTDRIKVAVEGTWQLIVESAEIEAWSLLGYPTWDEYVQREFATAQLVLPREHRQEVVGSLHDRGLSIRRIAAITNVPVMTVQNELARVRTRTPDPVITEALSELAGSEPITYDEKHATHVTGRDGKQYAATRPTRSEPVPESVRKAREDDDLARAHREAIFKRSEAFDQAIDLLAEIGRWPERATDLRDEYLPLYPTNPVTDDKLRLAADGLEAMKKAWS